MLAKILPLIPDTKIYVEPYCGAASLFFARVPAPNEVLNDLDDRLVNLFRCLQNPEIFPQLKRRLDYTLYSRSEFLLAIKILREANRTTDIDRAWAFFVLLNQGFNGIPSLSSTGSWGRTFTSIAGMAENTKKWIDRKSLLPDFHSRLMRVQIDCRDALQVIKYWDSPDTCFYIDPPYVSSTRVNSSRDIYGHESGDDHHRELVETMLGCRGSVILSGYYHHCYMPLDAAGWSRIKFPTACYAAVRNRNSGLQGKGAAMAKVARTEVIWRNPRSVTLTGIGAQEVLSLT